MIMYVNTPNQGSLNMRELPQTKCSILYKIPNGTAVEGETTGEWTRVSYQGEVGDVMTKFLSTEVQPRNVITTEDSRRVDDG